MNKQILKLAIPNILSNISVPLLSTVDTILMGNLSTLYLGAIGLGSMIFNFIYWNFGFLRMGTTGLTAQGLGRKDNDEISGTLLRALVLSLFISVIMLALMIPFYEVMAYLLNVASDQNQLVYEYFKIRMLAAPATLALYVLFGWFFGMQNAIYPLILTIAINVVNIIFSALFVLKFEWDIAGVAYGTVIAQYVGVLLALILVFVRYQSYVKGLKKSFVLNRSKMLMFLKLNSDIFLRTICLTSVFLFFYSQSSKAGAVILGVNVVLLQFLNWMSYGIDGFAYASESLVGKYYGANEDKNYFRAIKLSLIWGGAMALIYSIVYGLWGTELLGLFSNDDEVINASGPYMIWMVILPVMGFASYIWDGIYVGQTASKGMRNSMIISLVFFFGLYYVMGGMRYSSHVIWAAMTLFLLMRGLIQTGLFLRYKKALR